MTTAEIPIWEAPIPGYNQAYGQPVPSITPYLVQASAATSAVVVCPGGGYEVLADHEGEPVAHWLNTLGISVFVLRYRLTPYHHPYPLLDARQAIHYVRSRASSFNIDPRRVGILGFSAGGHLAAASGTFSGSLPIGLLEHVYPDAMILCYPVISFGRHRHDGSAINLLGENASAQLTASLSAELQVGAHTPSAFLWHTADDAVVPVQNSLLFSEALAAKHIPFELHIFPSGEHGLGLAAADPHIAQWTTLCGLWLKQQGFC